MNKMKTSKEQLISVFKEHEIQYKNTDNFKFVKLKNAEGLEFTEFFFDLFQLLFKLQTEAYVEGLKEQNE